MKNTFNHNYQKQLFQIGQQTVDFKGSILKAAVLLANNGKEKKFETSLAMFIFIRRKQSKLNDPNINEVILLLKSIDDTVVKLEAKLELKNEFKKEVFEKEVYFQEQGAVTEES